MKRKIYNPPRASAWHGRQLYHHKPTIKKTAKIKAWIKSLVILIVVGLISVLALFWWVSKDLPTPEGIAHRLVPQSTKIYDRTGKTILYDIHGEVRRTSVELSSIPTFLKQAVLVAEDRNFYQHQGFQFTSMVRSLIVNVIKGDRAQGGSTITQQFIKNAILGTEKSFTRKFKEIILAYQIEKKFSKDEILKLYFNEIPYGSNAYGAEAASLVFFGKSVSSLNLAESAILAAIPKSPTHLSPWGSHLDELIGRQHYILEEMVKEGYIKEPEAQEAKNYQLKFIPRRENIIAPHFIFYVRELLADRYGEKIVEQGGLKVISTIDLEAQKIAEEAIKQSEEKNLSYNAANASLVALDPKTGQILAMVGSRDYFDDNIDGQVNVAIRSRQPGSSFKPIVYTAAFVKGYLPETLLFDVVTTFKTDTKDYTPHNYNNKEYGPVPLRQALAGSLNIPAVKLLYLTGIDNVLNLADQLGYTTLKDRSRFGLSLVLGGAEVKLLEHTNAYATLAREGNYLPTTSILKVEDSDGRALEEFKQSEGKIIIDPEITRETTSILSDNEARSFIFGIQNYLTLPDRPVAAKTGTTNDYRDAWTLGYTPSLACGVWVGNSNNKEMKKGADGSVLAAPIWQYFMNKVLQKKPVEQFIAPPLKTINKPMVGGQLYGTEILIDKNTGRLATDLTPASAIERKKFKQYHTILNYINKNNPAGSTPPDLTDPQYQNWETAVRNWMTTNNLSDETVPSVYDNVHTEENRPRVYFSQPINNQTITNNPFDIKISASANRGVRRLVYLMDNKIIGESQLSPFTYNFTVTDDWANGFHTLTAQAYDDVDNMGTTNININLLVTPQPSPYKITWLSPTPETILKSNESINLTLTINQPDLVKKIDFFYKNQDNNSSGWFGFVEEFNNQPLSISGKLDGHGHYLITPLIQTLNGNTKNSNPLLLTVQ